MNCQSSGRFKANIYSKIQKKLSPTCVISPRNLARLPHYRKNLLIRIFINFLALHVEKTYGRGTSPVDDQKHILVVTRITSGWAMWCCIIGIWGAVIKLVRRRSCFRQPLTPNCRMHPGLPSQDWTRMNSSSASWLKHTSRLAGDGEQYPEMY